nr:uncharacterized protein LOC114924211 [Arachis hypogaea]
MEDETRLYRLNGVTHVAGSIDDEPTRVISGVRRQQNMPLHKRIIPYLETAGLYHLARLNSHWFWVDEPLLSAFIERWRPETHTFHMPFGECTITLQDVAYQLGLPIDREPVSGCLTDFENLMEHGRPAWDCHMPAHGPLDPAKVQNQQPPFDLNQPRMMGMPLAEWTVLSQASNKTHLLRHLSYEMELIPRTIHPNIQLCE